MYVDNSNNILFKSHFIKVYFYAYLCMYIVEGYLADKVCVRSHEASLRGEPPAPGELRHAGAELGHVEPECLLEEEQA